MQTVRVSGPLLSKPYILVGLELDMGLSWSSGYHYTREFFAAVCIRLVCSLGSGKAKQAMGLREVQ